MKSGKIRSPPRKKLRIVVSDTTSIGQPSFSRQARTSAKSIGAHHNAIDAAGQRPSPSCEQVLNDTGGEYRYAKVVHCLVPPYPGGLASPPSRARRRLRASTMVQNPPSRILSSTLDRRLVNDVA